MKHFYLFLLSFVYISTSAQDMDTLTYQEPDSLDVAFVAYWNIGDSYDFQISKYQRDWKNGELIVNDSVTYIANFKVVDSTEHSYKIKWTFRDEILSLINVYKEKYDLDPDDKFSKKGEETTHIFYETDEWGEFKGVLNQEEWAKTTLQRLENFILSIDNEKIKFELVQKLISSIKNYSSKAAIEQVLLQEIQYIHTFFGGVYDPREPIEYEDEYDNILNEEIIRGNAVLFFEEVDYENYFCSIRQESKLNTDDVFKMLDSYMRQSGIPENEVDHFIENAIYEIDDLNYYEFYYTPGVPHGIYGSRTINVELMEEQYHKVEEILIELIYEEDLEES